MTERFHVLHVCTGNIGRSPMAERLMRMRLEKVLGSEEATASFQVDSAGTWGHTGSLMEPFAKLALEERGVDPTGFTARELTEDQVRSADLVLTATAEHRTTVVSLVPGALHRTFTLREFARLAPSVMAALPDTQGSLGEAPGDLPARARRAVPAALGARGRAPRPDPLAADDVADPLGAPAECYRARADEIDAACAEVVALLTGAQP